MDPARPLTADEIRCDILEPAEKAVNHFDYLLYSEYKKPDSLVIGVPVLSKAVADALETVYFAYLALAQVARDEYDAACEREEQEAATEEGAACPVCHGSGEGQRENTACFRCHGSGEFRPEPGSDPFAEDAREVAVCE